MLRFLLTLILTIGVNSLSLYSVKTYYEIIMPDIEDNSVNFNVNDDPPPHSEVAKMARFIVHNSGRNFVIYQSLEPKTNDYPMGAVQSVSDGPVDNSKGTPYMFVSELEDLDNRCTLTMTLAQTDYCKNKKIDPKFPLCAQVWLVGRFNRVKNETEMDFAKDALFSRHPTMKNWPKDHHFFFAKLDIEQILVQDYFGGPVPVNVADYYNASP
ncbi:hypothetical protein L9F63_019962 [Diploptera punctata]|uniref:CREG-like beta-barrel domain-containing protein n=1 Tax=Diploptera punctata TaxID=6984 RepID=A0AAD7ZTX8_DIPPU|nr:hypothetical protein L9F63_019962 [Diploptera punctata]